MHDPPGDPSGYAFKPCVAQDVKKSADHQFGRLLHLPGIGHPGIALLLGMPHAEPVDRLGKSLAEAVGHLPGFEPQQVGNFGEGTDGTENPCHENLLFTV